MTVRDKLVKPKKYSYDKITRSKINPDSYFPGILNSYA